MLHDGRRRIVGMTSAQPARFGIDAGRGLLMANGPRWRQHEGSALRHR